MYRSNNELDLNEFAESLKETDYDDAVSKLANDMERTLIRSLKSISKKYIRNLQPSQLGKLHDFIREEILKIK